MDFQELQRFIKIEDKRIKKYFRTKTDPEKHVLARMVKLTEEVGELAAEVLAHHNWQRQEKLDRRSQDDLGHELADVVITTFMLADTLQVDMAAALRAKMKKIEQRYRDKRKK
ncbi:MAG: MazG-like family protein [Patescibacteria group bacterium]